LELELGDARFAINAWSKKAIDAVGAMDVQEHDATKFGYMQIAFLNMECSYFFYFLFIQSMVLILIFLM
jgi:hypothetical protein